MNNQLTTLCLIPKDTWIQPNWSGIGCEEGQPRKLYLCLTNICIYEGDVPVRVKDWAAAISEFKVTVQEMHTFPQLIELMHKLVPQQAGVFVYNGITPLSCNNKRPGVEQRIKHYKTCMQYPGSEYAGSYSSSLSDLWGFDPDAAYGEPFTLGWFNEADPIASKIIQRFDQWPDSQCNPMLPPGPSPSSSSIELTGQGDDTTVIGLFMGDSTQPNLQPDRLRELLGEDAILAGVDAPDFLQWLENDISFEDLIPVDRPLPFCG